MMNPEHLAGGMRRTESPSAEMGEVARGESGGNWRLSFCINFVSMFVLDSQG